MNIGLFNYGCHRFFALVAFTLLLGGCVDHRVNEGGVEYLEQSNQSRPDTINIERATLSLKVNVGIIRDARESSLLNEVWTGVNDIYQQCDISVSFDTQTTGFEVERIIDRENRIQLSKKYKNESPTVFFVPNTAEVDVAFSYLPSYDSPLASTFWITDRVSERCLVWITAHELGHVLLDSAKHSNVSINVMSKHCKVGNWNNQLAKPKWNAEQCSALRISSFFVP